MRDFAKKLGLNRILIGFMLKGIREILHILNILIILPKRKKKY